ncbi:beta-propeller fold lactonase family protein [Streptacidiphilus melanogenes]|uniref:YVTN family beta-propeller repeat protein n=1 Tax=Streptacidiphilus melanogenes TaxID=411235 RepID=UPI00069382CF|nr:IPT/TIG domain-containing protein [Streptacidiphilus melanogenes]
MPTGHRRTVALSAVVGLALAGALGGNVAAAQAASASPSTPGGVTTAFVADAGSNSVSVVDVATGALKATVADVGYGPQGVAAAPDGGHVYVPNIGSNNVAVIDTETDTLAADVAVGASPTAAVVSPDGSRVYVANQGTDTVSVIDTTSDAVVGTVTVGAGPDALAVSPDGSRVFVADSGGGGALSVIDTATDAVTGTLPLGGVPVAVAPTPDGSRLYVAEQGAASLSVVDTGAAVVVDTVAVPAAPYALALSPDGSRLYLADGPANSVAVLDTASGTTTTIPVGGDPQGIAVTPDGSRVLVTDLGAASVSTIDAGDDQVVGATPVGADPAGVAVALTVPAPVVTGVSPASGPPGGGTAVTVAGSHLSGATGIDFGPGKPAASFSCGDQSCTAVSPPGAVGTVDVRVTTPGGTSATSQADQFAYTAADVGVTLAATPRPALLGGSIVYTVTVTDHGPSALTSGTVSALLPTPMAGSSGDCAVSGRGVSCSVGPLAVGASATRQFTVPVGLLTLGLPYTVTVGRSASSPVDLNPANDSASRSCTVITSLLINCS